MKKDDFCAAFCSQLQLTEVPIGYVLKTPFLKEDGDYIAIYIRRHEKNAKQFRLEDDGETIAFLEAQGVDFDSESRFEALADLLRAHDANYDESESLLHTGYFDEQKIPGNTVLFLSLMNRIWDLLLLNKTRVRNTFRDDLLRLVEQQFSDAAKIRTSEPLQDSMKDYVVDIIVESRDGRSLAIFAATSELKALEALLFSREQQAMTSRADSLTFEELQEANMNATADIVKVLQEQARLRSAGYEGASLEWRAAAEIERLSAEIKELHSQLEFADMTISKFNSGEVLQRELERSSALAAALAEAREVMQRIASLLPGGRDGLDDDHHVLISQLTMGDLRRAAKWLERNPAP